MPTFKNLQDDVLERLNFDASVASSTPRTRMKRFINEWYRRVLAQPFMSRVRDTPLTITTVIGTAEYVVTASSLRELYDATNDWALTERSLGWLRERDPGSDANGNPVAFIIKSRTATGITVRLWPTPASVNTIKVDAESLTTELVADGDIPIIPADFHYLLGDGALVNEYLRMGDMERASFTRQSVEKGMRDLRVRLYTAPGGKLVPGRTARLSGERSRLGANFPADY